MVREEFFCGVYFFECFYFAAIMKLVNMTDEDDQK